jgi:hypothetical protein
VALSFPNRSRSYDPDRRRIRFWGHDLSNEVPFFLDEAAVFRLLPRTVNDEAGILAGFDSVLDRIIAVATRIYGSGSARRHFYVLEARDF